MAAYLVALGNIYDQERFAKYLAGIGPTLAHYSGELLAVEDPAEVLEGEAPFPRVVLLKFPSKDNARQWQNSVDYQQVAEDRLVSSDHVFYLLNEFLPPTN